MLGFLIKKENVNIMTEFDKIKKLCNELTSLMNEPNCTNVKWNNEVRKVIQEIAEYDNMCMFSTEDSLMKKNNF